MSPAWQNFATCTADEKWVRAYVTLLLSALLFLGCLQAKLAHYGTPAGAGKPTSARIYLEDDLQRSLAPMAALLSLLFFVIAAVRRTSRTIQVRLTIPYSAWLRAGEFNRELRLRPPPR
jgi:hypothetical protein